MVKKIALDETTEVRGKLKFSEFGVDSLDMVILPNIVLTDVTDNVTL